MKFKTGPQWVSPYTQTYLNRYVDPKRIEKLIREQKEREPGSNGYSEKLAGAIDVAILDCPGHRLHGQMFRWDGGHRTEIFIQSGQQGNILANVSIVHSEQELKDLYETKNGEGSKRLSKEDLFVNNSHKESDLVELLIRSKLGVTNNVHIVGNVTGPFVKVEGIRSLRRKVSDRSIEQASLLLRQTVKPTSKGEYPVELLSGVAIVFERHKFSQKDLLEFQNYVKTMFELNDQTISRLHRGWKSAGGAVNTKGSESVALGIAIGLKKKGMKGINPLVNKLKQEVKLV